MAASQASVVGAALPSSPSPSSPSQLRNGPEYCPYHRTARNYDVTRRAVGAGIIIGAAALHAGGRPLGKQRLLDVGCGTGQALQALLRSRVFESLHGVDLNQTMLAVASSKLAADAASASVDPPLLQQAEAARLPVADGSVDVVTCNQVLHHFPVTEESDARFAYVKEAMREAMRVLRPGGAVVVNMMRPEHVLEGFWFAEVLPQAAAIMASRLPPVQTVLDALAAAGADVSQRDNLTLPLCPLMDPEEYVRRGLEGALDPVFRDGCSLFAIADQIGETPDAAISAIRSKPGGEKAFFERKEKDLERVGQHIFVVARKPL